MNQRHLYDVTRTMTSLPSRRDVLRGLTGVGLGFGIVPRANLIEARKKRKGKKRKARHVQPNEFGCREFGDPCKSEADCCSGICEGTKGKQRCGAHDIGGCFAGASSIGCGGTVNVTCTTGPGEAGACVTTTGNAGYCRGALLDHSCQTDLDCQAVNGGQLGPRAACVRCADASGGSLCAAVAGTPS